MSAQCSRHAEEISSRLRQLNRGYVDYPDFFLRYCSSSKADGRTPTLELSLDAVDAQVARHVLSRVPQPANCLIEGITAPSNGTSLRAWLSGLGIAPGCVRAVDIMDVESLALSFGHRLKDVEFTVADASDLQGWDNGSVHVIVQDHLLNCAPHSLHARIVSEAARVLHADGVWILNFSVDPVVADAAPLTVSEAESLCSHPWRSDAYSMAEMWHGSDGHALHGVLVAESWDEHRWTLVTPPHGNLEFFFGFATLERLLRRTGLRFAWMVRSRESDAHGVSCMRYRTLVTRL